MHARQLLGERLARLHFSGRARLFDSSMAQLVRFLLDPRELELALRRGLRTHPFELRRQLRFGLRLYQRDLRGVHLRVDLVFARPGTVDVDQDLVGFLVVIVGSDGWLSTSSGDLPRTESPSDPLRAGR